MYKFIKKLLIGSAIPVVLLLVLNYFYVRTDYYATLNNADKFYNLPPTIQVANFGNSHSLNGFDWSAYPGINAANMALGSQTLVYDNAIFTNYYDKFEQGATVIIELSYRTLYEPELTVDQAGSQITRYYQFLDLKNIYNPSTATAIRYKYFPILGASLGQMKHIFDGKASNAKSAVHRLTGQLPEKLAESGKNRAEGFLGQIGKQELGIQYESLLKIIDKCRAKDINLVFITMPTLQYYYTVFPDSFYRQFYDDIKNICALYDKTYYIDYTGDERFKDALDLYQDVDHLNEDGAVYFTEIIMNDITKLGIAVG